MTGLVASGESVGPGLGVKYLLVAGLVTGVLQILWGYLRLADQMRFVPQGVLSGFVNALALLIFQAQLPQLGLHVPICSKARGTMGEFQPRWSPGS